MWRVGQDQGRELMGLWDDLPDLEGILMESGRLVGTWQCWWVCGRRCRGVVCPGVEGHRAKNSPIRVEEGRKSAASGWGKKMGLYSPGIML